MLLAATAATHGVEDGATMLARVLGEATVSFWKEGVQPMSWNIPMPDPDAGDVSALAASTVSAWLTSTTSPDIGEATQESTAEGKGGWKRPVMFFMERQGGTSSAGGVGSTSTEADAGELTLTE